MWFVKVAYVVEGGGWRVKKREKEGGGVALEPLNKLPDGQMNE